MTASRWQSQEHLIEKNSKKTVVGGSPLSHPVKSALQKGVDIKTEGSMLFSINSKMQ